MSLGREYSFWGSLSPLGGLSGASLLIIASARLSWAITTAIGLFWVYAFSSLVFALMNSKIDKKYFPSVGRSHVFTCLASFFGSCYLLLFWLMCPFAAFEAFIPILLIPLFCAASGICEGSGVFERIEYKSENVNLDLLDHVSDAVSQAAVLALLIIGFSIIREPLSYCSLTFPGTANGMITIVSFRSGSFFPIGIFASSSGALLLLGFLVCLYQFGKSIFAGRY